MTNKAILTEMIERTVSDILKGIGTAIPGAISLFDPDTQLAKVQPGIKRIDIQGVAIDIAPIINVPVHFMGGKFAIEYEINEGDEGLIIISQRCIDGWIEEGGVAVPPVLRKLDMNDALFIPGFRSKPNAMPDFQNDGIRMRNEDGTKHIWLRNSGAVEIVSDTLTHNGVNIGETHTHSGVETGGGTSGPPT